MPDTAALQRMAARFAPTEIGADLTKLTASDRLVLKKLVEASQIVDGLFLRQAWSGNESMLLDLAQDHTPEGRARLHYFIINKGPWDRLDHRRAFIPGAPARPVGGNFYPADATKAELEQWIQSLPAAERERATGFFTVVRRTPDGKGFSIVPYNVEYEGELSRAASLLREAAAAATEPTLKAFLEKRAAAFLSNDYYDSDVAWMELTGAIEPTIGPYEVYEDELFNYKAGFESYITVQDDGETAKLQKFGGELQDIEDHLPIDPKLRNPKLGALAPIVVVNMIFGAGDGNRGVQTAAYNLPNDDRVIREKGSKRVMLKNIQDAKFAKTLVPISKVVLRPSDQPYVSFDAFFTHTVVHELMHGLGPAQHHRRRPRDQRAAGAEGNLQRARRGEGRHLGALRHPAHDRQGRAAEDARTPALHDVPGVDVPRDPLRRRRGARPRHRAAAQLPARSRRVRRAHGRHVRRRLREGEGRRRRADARDHDDSGRRRLCEGEGARRDRHRAARRSRRCSTS